MEEKTTGRMMTEHTPIPWRTRFPGALVEDVKAVYDGNGRHIATFHDPEARQQAIRAVNCFDELLAALEECVEQLTLDGADRLPCTIHARQALEKAKTA